MRIRIPADLEVEIRIASGQNGRSMNAEIVHRLARSFADNSIIGFEAANANLSKIVKDLSALMGRISIEDVYDFLEDREERRAAERKERVAKKQRPQH